MAAGNISKYLYICKITSFDFFMCMRTRIIIGILSSSLKHDLYQLRDGWCARIGKGNSL